MELTFTVRQYLLISVLIGTLDEPNNFGRGITPYDRSNYLE